MMSVWSKSARIKNKQVAWDSHPTYPSPSQKSFRKHPPFSTKLESWNFQLMPLTSTPGKTIMNFANLILHFFIRTTGSGTITTTIVKNRNHSLQKKSFLQDLLSNFIVVLTFFLENSAKNGLFNADLYRVCILRPT